MMSSAMSYPTRLLSREQQAALVTYKLTGNRIKSALLMNPGKVVICPRQSGKTASLAEYIMEHCTYGAIVFCAFESAALQIRRSWPWGYFEKCIIVWGQGEPAAPFGWNLPIFADEICLIGGTRQRQIVRNPRFAGAVSSPSDFTEEEVRIRCILS